MRAFMALLKDWLFVDGVGLAWDVVTGVDGKGSFIKERNVMSIYTPNYLYIYFMFQLINYLENLKFNQHMYCRCGIVKPSRASGNTLL